MTRLEMKDFADNLFLIAGPCVMESFSLMQEVAGELARLRDETGITAIFKASYDKANRTSLKGKRGPGIDEGMKMLDRIRRETGLPVLTDIHTEEEATIAGSVVDILQIPAFLCRQTDLVLAAAKTDAIVNIKKGQFLAPWDMKKVVEKARSENPRGILLTERGVSFGYNTLVSDMRSIPLMSENNCPVVYDATHSVQSPGGKGDSSGGDRRFVPVLSKAAIAAGADGLFWETHPNPDSAWSDGPNMIPLQDLSPLFRQCLKIWRAAREK